MKFIRSLLLTALAVCEFKLEAVNVGTQRDKQTVSVGLPLRRHRRVRDCTYRKLRRNHDRIAGSGRLLARRRAQTSDCT
jgi:hypothetical protein